MSATKYKGTATNFFWVTNAGSTVDIWTESRTFEVTEAASTIDATVRGDSAKRNLVETPDITISAGGLDYVPGSATMPTWDSIAIGSDGTVVWAPNGTAVGSRKRSMAAILNSKGYNTPYESFAEWSLEFASNGGTVVQAYW